MNFKPEKRNVLFVGLDCATYWIVEKLIAQGRMPHLANLMQRGTTVRTETEEPVISPVVWTTISSAKTPEKHGVKSFHATSASVKVKRIWDIFMERGSDVGIMGHFVIWPLREVKGFMVPDLLALDEQTHPADLSFLRSITESNKTGKRLGTGEMLQHARKARSYGVKYSTLFSSAFEVLKKKVVKRSLLDQQFAVRDLKQRLYSDVFVELCRRYRPQYAYFHNHFIDTCSHIFWKFLEPEKFGDVSTAELQKYGDKLFQAYEKADATLGKILQLVQEDTLVVVASDHGAKAAVADDLNWRIPGINAEALMQTLKIEKDVSYSNVGFEVIVKPRVESEENKQKVKSLFSQIKIAGQDTPLFQINERDSSNIWLSLNNTISEIDGVRVRLNGSVYKLEKFVQVSDDRTSGVHDGKNAILVMAGKGVKSGIKLETAANVLDIIPTILTLTHLPVASDMDGQVLTEVISEDFLNEFPVQYIKTYEEAGREEKKSADDLETSEELKDHLRALGYL